MKNEIKLWKKEIELFVFFRTNIHLNIIWRIKGPLITKYLLSLFITLFPFNELMHCLLTNNMSDYKQCQWLWESDAAADGCRVCLCPGCIRVGLTVLQCPQWNGTTPSVELCVDEIPQSGAEVPTDEEGCAWDHPRLQVLFILNTQELNFQIIVCWWNVLRAQSAKQTGSPWEYWYLNYYFIN